MEDSAGRPGTRIDLARGWFIHGEMAGFLSRRCGLWSLGQSRLLSEDERAYQQDGRQQQCPVKNASVHNQLSRRRERYARLLEAKLFHNRKLADNVRQKFQYQIATCVRGNRRRKREPDHLGGNARFGVVGHNQSGGGSASANP
jgi:hypothetical protein